MNRLMNTRRDIALNTEISMCYDELFFLFHARLIKAVHKYDEDGADYIQIKQN